MSKSLEETTGLRVARVMGSPSAEFGNNTMTFRIESIVLENGAVLLAEGEHDHPYICSDEHVPGLSNDELLAAYNAIYGGD